MMKKEITKLLLQFFLTACYFLPLKSKYSHHQILKHPKHMQNQTDIYFLII